MISTWVRECQFVIKKLGMISAHAYCLFRYKFTEMMRGMLIGEVNNGNMIVDIRSYRLRSGSGEAFVDLLKTRAIPLLQEFDIMVIDYGSSEVDYLGKAGAYLLRTFDSPGDRQWRERVLYQSSAWRTGPGRDLLDQIEICRCTVVDTCEATVRQMRTVM